jgi:transcriptional regulator with XRE-family HTH domain
MEEAGQRLKRVRERLDLRYRDVEEASVKIADRHNNSEFILGLSRLADIENKGTVPTLYRLYSLCAIYRLDPYEVMGWYGIDLSMLAADAALVEVERTHTIGFTDNGHGTVQVPLALDPGLDLRKTSYLSLMIQRWGRLPLMLLNGIDVEEHRYAFIGAEDWFMYPLLQPGSLVLIDETKRKVVSGGWSNEFDRPIYFLETRTGFACAWCTEANDQLILLPHPASPQATPQIYRYPEDIEVVGQITGLAMRLDQAKKRRARSATG